MRRQTHQYAHSEYVSEFEKFINQFLEEHPSVLESQREGWNIFWDHNIEPDDLKRAYQDTVPLKAYPYD
ncbi:MAG: DUF3460 family protein [Burkholderiaceae bacterium]